MKYPEWAPHSLVEMSTDYQAFLKDGKNNDHPRRESIRRDATIWLRLATRPEMEKIWAYVFKRLRYSQFAHPDMLTANGGLLKTMHRKLRSWDTDPLLTTKQYEIQISEIAELANKLANKLKKFCEIEEWRSPFNPSSLLTGEEIDRARTMMRSELFLKMKSPQSGRGWASYMLGMYLPPVNVQLQNLARRAKEESKDKMGRLSNLPRKVGDKSAFRTYFIGTVQRYFLVHFADSSPTRLATFCSVALDDPEITADLVRKLYPIAASWREQRKGLKEALREVVIS